MLRIKLKSGTLISEVEGAYILKYKEEEKSSYFKVSRDYSHLLSRLQLGLDLHEIIGQQSNGEKATVMAFITKLSDFGLLEGRDPVRIQRPQSLSLRIKSALSSLLKIKIFQFDPDRLLTWMYNHLRLDIFYRLSFLIPAFAFSFVMLGVLYLQDFFLISAPLPSQKLAYSIVFYLFLALGMIVHELAHSITCKRWGGEVRSLGFLVYYFMPAGFSDISDSYLFDKFKRISVLLAGPLTTVFIGLWLGGIWLVTETGTFINSLAYYLTLLSILGPLFSLNPLLKFDGYYLLTEIVSVENLRGRSFGYLKDLLKYLLLHQDMVSLPPKKEKVIYIVYGTISGFYSIAFLSFALYRLTLFISDLSLS